MQKELIVQGRVIAEKDIAQITEMMISNPEWGRSKLSKELCHLWDWRNQKGTLKDIACRSLLQKLEGKGYITLPERRSTPHSRMRDKRNIQLPMPSSSIASTLAQAKPLNIEIAKAKTTNAKLFAVLLAQHHYLGYKGSVGEHLSYLIWDRAGGLLGCILFGAAAYRISPRDEFIGWNEEQRRRNLALISNNMRFLLLKRIPHLASHLLGKIARQISMDFQEKYGHEVVMLETFVEIRRFAGTCYRSANWIALGQTMGRGRNSQGKKPSLPVKAIYVYPLKANFREILCS